MSVNLTVFLLNLLYSFIYCLKENPEIFVIGSGPSGIAAASKLWKHNFTNLKILEAENRIGGRVNSVKFGDAYVDLGGEWCHGQKGNIVYDMVKSYNILRHNSSSFKLVYSNGSFLDDDIFENLENFAEHLEPSKSGGRCKNVTSVGECFENEFNSTFVQLYSNNPDKLKISLELDDFLESYILSYDSPFTLYDLATETNYIQCEGDLGMHWNGRGYKTILEVMLQKYPDPSKQLPIDNNIFLNKEVTKITWNNQKTTKVALQCADKSSFEADYVIFTPSLGVLKANHEELFEPGLPEDKVKAIKGTGFGAILKVILHFPETWWNPNYIYGFVWSTEDKRKILSEFGKGPVKNGKSWLTTATGFFGAENNPKVLIGFFAGAMVPDIEKEDDQVIMDGCMHLFRKFLGGTHSIANADSIIKTTWYSNPHFRGTYSYDSVKGHSVGQKYQEKLASPLECEDEVPCVLFAGEATHPYYYSTVHGAIETGYREADRIINLYAQT